MKKINKILITMLLTVCLSMFAACGTDNNNASDEGTVKEENRVEDNRDANNNAADNKDNGTADKNNAADNNNAAKTTELPMMCRVTQQQKTRRKMVVPWQEMIWPGQTVRRMKLQTIETEMTPMTEA